MTANIFNYRLLLAKNFSVRAFRSKVLIPYIITECDQVTNICVPCQMSHYASVPLCISPDKPVPYDKAESQVGKGLKHSPTFYQHHLMGKHNLYSKSDSYYRKALHFITKNNYSTSATGEINQSESPNFTALGVKIIEEAKKIDVMVGSVPLMNVINLLKDLHALGFTLDHLSQTLSERVWLLFEPEGTKSLFQLLQSHGFHNEMVVEVIKNISVVDRNDSIKGILEHIRHSLEFLRTIGFSEHEFQSFLISEPGLLMTDPKKIYLMQKQLNGFFTVSDTLSIIKKNPNVLVDTWAETHKKFDYAFFTMGYIQSQIVQSHLFSHSFAHIQDRHLFLYRTGFFFPVKPKDDPKLNPNPPLKDVIDIADELFVKKFGGLNMGEYTAFLYMRELEREEEGDMIEEISESESKSDEEKDKKFVKKKMERKSNKRVRNEVS